MIDSHNPPAPKAPLSPVLARFLNQWKPPLRYSIVAGSIVLAAVAAICLIRAYIGLSVVRYWTDVFIYLDGGWRVLHGQMPQRDFYGSVGPITYWLAALGLLLDGGTAQGWIYAQALFGFLLGVWAYFLTIRFGRLPAALLTFTVTLFALAPFNFGEVPSHLSGGMVYNRFSYAIVALILIESMQASPFPRRWTEFAGGFSTGLAIAILLFLKISFFLGAGVLVAALVPSKPQVLRRWIGMISGFLLFVFVVFIIYQGDFTPIFDELRTVAQTKHLVFRSAYVETAVNSGLPFLGLVALGASLLWKRGFRREGVAVLVSGLAVLATGFGFLISNWQLYDLPLNALMAILIVQKLVARPALSDSAAFLPAVCLGMVLAVAHMSIDVYGLAIGIPKHAALARDPSTRFDAAVLEGFRCDDRDYVRWVNDGLALARRYRVEGDTLMTLDLVNPFSYTLGIPPPQRGATWLGYGNNFDEVHGPPPERIFGNASLVMEPRESTDPNIPVVYGGYLSDHFQMLGESAQWRIFRRRSVRPSQALLMKPTGFAEPR
ncbi:MAG: hypothetical protein JWO19_1158 [Bryobacterales bacterium]|jgi:hypothetical protein|nr:hypothetical protein [Bryobacterales bacterium]